MKKKKINKISCYICLIISDTVITPTYNVNNVKNIIIHLEIMTPPPSNNVGGDNNRLLR